MIIEPDFFEHWKTKTLVALTGRPESPLWLMRLWAHCQARKAWQFHALPEGALKGICAISADISEKQWIEILVQCRLLEQKADTITVHDWKKHNASLVSAWRNGKKGGRPKQPNVNRQQTHGLLRTNPVITDREDRRDGIDGEEKKEGEGMAEPTATAPRARPEDLEEVKKYAESIGMSCVEAVKFFDHFEANGWRQAGRTPIVCWQASARSWRNRCSEFVQKNPVRLMRGETPALNGPNAHTGGLEVFQNIPGNPSDSTGDPSSSVADSVDSVEFVRRMAVVGLAFRRSDAGRWNSHEVEAFKHAELATIPPDQFDREAAAVVAFYQADIPEAEQRRHWRRTELIRVLQNWPGELDKARSWAKDVERVAETRALGRL